jgi:hypothetical protein
VSDPLPPEFDDLARQAVRDFWSARSGGTSVRQGANRDAVIGGKNLDGFVRLVTAVTTHCGLPTEAVLTSGTATMALPGFYRPTKRWDTLVMLDGHLLAVFEYKSQVGPSFGNNFNNRAEEALGNATDLHAAQDNGAFVAMDRAPRDKPPLFAGYVMVLEDCADSRSVVGIGLKHFPVLPEFVSTSYADRYNLLCEKLVTQRLYSAAALVLTERAAGLATGAHTHLSASTSLRFLFARFAGELTAFLDAHHR